MNNTVQILLYILFAAVFLLVGFWFYNNFGWVKKEQQVGFQGIAKTNDLLAAEFFLRQMGVDARQVNGLYALRNLPSSQHTLLITTERETLNKELTEALLQWIRSGGHLIVKVRHHSSKKSKSKKDKQVVESDALLDNLSVFAARSNASKKNKDIPVTINLGNQLDSNIEVNFPYFRILSRYRHNQKNDNADIPQPIWTIQDELGDYLLQFRLGQGLLTVLTSTQIFTNEEIAKFNHARFLHYLVQLPEHDAGVWMIRTDEMPALWQWLWNNIEYTMFCLSFLLLLWLWQTPFRFGPRLNDVQTERRSLLEHIQAIGYYRWHEKQSGVLLRKVQDNLWEKIHILHPTIRRENLSQAYTLLSEITHIKDSVIKQALSPVKEIDEHDFTHAIKIIMQIHQRL